MQKKLVVAVPCFKSLLLQAQNICINATGVVPKTKAMTTTQCDAITSPPNGLMVNNITSTRVVYRNTQWEKSTDVSVFIENLTVIPFSGSTKAYDFVNDTGINLDL